MLCVRTKARVNPFYLKGPGIKALNLAVEKTATKVYVYDSVKFNLINGKPFQSIRLAAAYLPIAASTLPSKLNTNLCPVFD